MRPIEHDHHGDKVARLLRIVERLDVADQRRICRIVRLLAMVPAADQDETFRLLRGLLEQAPSSRYECSIRIDDVIEFLESRAIRGADLALGAERYANGGFRPS